MSFALMLVYTTMLYIRPMEWQGSPLYGWELGGFGVMDFLTVLLLVVVAVKRVNEGGRVMRSATDWFVVCLWGAAMLSQAAHFNLWMLRITFQDFGKVILLYFLVVNIVDTRKKLKIFVALLVGLTAFMAVHGVLQIHAGAGFGGQLPLMDRGQARIVSYGFFNDPNDLGLTFVVIMPLLLAGMAAYHAAPVRALSAGVLGLCGYGLYLTGSRGAMVALVVAAFVYFYKRFGKTVAAVLGMLLLVGLAVYGPSRIQTMEDDPSGSGRREVWSEGLGMLKENPPLNAMFGVGWNCFNDHEEKGKTAHNSYLLTVAEMGLVGLFFYLGSFYMPLRDLHRLTVAEPPGEGEDPEEPDEEARSEFRSDQGLARALIASMMGFMVASFFLSRAYNQVPFLLIGLCAALAQLSKSGEVAERVLPPACEEKTFYDFHSSDFRWVTAATLATVPVIYVVCRVLWRI